MQACHPFTLAEPLLALSHLPLPKQEQTARAPCKHAFMQTILITSRQRQTDAALQDASMPARSIVVCNLQT